MAILSKSPQFCKTKLVTVGDALDQLTAFNAMYESQAATSSANACGLSANDFAAWRNEVRDGVINCGGRPTELDFFSKLFPYDPKKIGASNLYIKYRCDIDFNMYAQAAAVGGAPGAATTFTIMRGLYAGSGKYSNINVGGSIYIYEDKQWCTVTAVDKTVDYAHVVTVVPWEATYTVNIRARKPMMFNPVLTVGGYSENNFHETWEAPGYINKISPLKIRKDWSLALNLTAPYQDVLQFAIKFDSTGRAVDAWDLYNTMKAREEVLFDKNQKFLLGQRITNPALAGISGDAQYPGFDGYLNTMYYGGGTVYDYDPTIGFDPEADFQPIILRQNAKKKSKNFMVVHGLNFRMGMNRRWSDIARNTASGALTLQTFTSMGMAERDIQKLDINSYDYLGYKLHFKEMDALTDQRSIGNYNMPNLGMMIPMDGNIDSNGNPVSPIEFFMPLATGEKDGGGFWESPVRDHRLLENGGEKLSGTIIEKCMIGIHCPQNHILLNPVFPCQ